MMRKIKALFLGCIMLFTCFPVAISAEDHLKKVIDPVTDVTVLFDSDTGELFITGSGSIKDYSCESSPWESYAEKIQKITISEGIREIGNHAFSFCTDLDEITVPDTLIRIGDYAFEGCESLQTMILPSHLEEIGEYAFYGCKNLEDIVIPSSVKTIGSFAFALCSSLETFTVHTNNPFYSSLNGALFNKDRTVMIAYPLGKKETAYTIPSSVKVLENGVFAGHETLTSVHLSKGMKDLGEETFAYTVLTSVIIPSTVTELKESVFSDCASLQEVTIPITMRSIATSAFFNCPSLQDVYYGGSEEEFDRIEIGEENIDLLLARLHCNVLPLEEEETSVDESFTVICKKHLYNAYGRCKNCYQYKPNIVPSFPMVKIRSVTRKKTSLTVKWQKNSSVKGYQLRYARKADMTYARTVSVSTNRRTYKKLKGLKRKTKYFLQVRSYRIRNAKKVYSCWSKIRAVKTR